MAPQNTKLPLGKTPNLDHLYEDYEVQSVLQAYVKNLQLSLIKGYENRVYKLSDGNLLLIPRDITDVDNLKKYSFAYMMPSLSSLSEARDVLTPRLQDFQVFVNKPAIKALGKKISFLVPIKESGPDHWVGLVVEFDPRTEKEKTYSYTFLDSKYSEPGHCPDIIKKAVQGVFGDLVQEKLESPGFYQQTPGSVSCGACLCANMMMKVGALKGEFLQNVDAMLRIEQTQMVPEIGWKTQPTSEKVADALFLLPSQLQEDLTAVVTKLPKEVNFRQYCEKLKTVWTNDQELISYIQNSYEKCKLDAPMVIRRIADLSEAQKYNNESLAGVLTTLDELGLDQAEIEGYLERCSADQLSIIRSHTENEVVITVIKGMQLELWQAQDNFQLFQNHIAVIGAQGRNPNVDNFKQFISGLNARELELIKKAYGYANVNKLPNNVQEIMEERIVSLLPSEGSLLLNSETSLSLVEKLPAVVTTVALPITLALKETMTVVEKELVFAAGGTVSSKLPGNSAPDEGGGIYKIPLLLFIMSAVMYIGYQLYKYVQKQNEGADREGYNNAVELNDSSLGSTIQSCIQKLVADYEVETLG